MIKFSKNISKKENLLCEHIFYYTAPPFQSNPPKEDEKKRKQNYDRFVARLTKNKIITVEEGRVQKINGEYHQKGVDTLLTMGLSSFKIDYPSINSIILIACDSDFVPIIEKLKSRGINVILYIFQEKKRNSIFSTSNHLLNSSSKHVELTEEDFNSAK
ncbi:NYN domain-containing protein [Candidatus Woesearchaeota archaeon]|nr:NYN domain-containing protein [Candidatus Woesearchaeota archaeon]